MSKISGQLLISGQFQDICDISGISGQLGALILSRTTRVSQHQKDKMSKGKTCIWCPHWG